MNTQEKFDLVVQRFEKETGLIGVRRDTVKKSGNDVLVLHVSCPTDRLFSILEAVRTSVADGEVPPLATLKAASTGNMLDRPEGKLLLKVLSEIQNINRYSFQQDFFSRYTKSVSGAESQIVAKANHVVLGRRGAGKSMLLLYAWQTRRHDEKPSVWVDMQLYSGRKDEQAIADVLASILQETERFLGDVAQHQSLIAALKASDISLEKIRRLLPEIKRLLAGFATRGTDLFVFLDDFHVLDQSIQPTLLDVLYSIARGNQIFLKLSAIETFVRTFEPSTRQGLEIPQDAQNVSLDYNLTAPDRAASHIEAILDSHAQYSGICSIRRLCISQDVLSRLTWVAAGVPRDALNLFAQAMTTASVEGRQRISVSNVNVAASKTLTIKLRDLETDASEGSGRLHALLDSIKNFCVSENRRNAFLVEIGGNPALFADILRLVNLRLLHVISEGITVGKAGTKFVGLVLDYGFYTGIRAAQSVDLFNRQSKKVAYKDLRTLPVYIG